MRWKRVKDENAEEAGRFLRDREGRCVSAAARFREAAGSADWKRNALWIGYEGVVPRSLLFFSSSGVLFPIMDDPDDGDNRRALTRALIHRRARSIQGTARETAAAELAVASLPVRLAAGFPREDAEPIDYDLMELRGMPRIAPLAAGPAGLSIAAAGELDADRLFPLQAAYETEEVIPRNGTFNAAASRLLLERNLRSGKPILMAELNGEIVGKAGINARGYSYDQVGGVYVLPELRGKGIGTRLAGELCARIAEKGRKIALFVKKRNGAARRAYEKAGFSVADDYRIVYYL